MAPGIILPTTLPDGTLYRVTYEGPSATKAWTYTYDFVRHAAGYTCRVDLRAVSLAALQRCRADDLEGLLGETRSAMQDIINDEATWHGVRATDPLVIARRMRITSALREPFGDVASRIIAHLPRLREATITAHYQ